jgi:hypothetical protein
MELADLTCSSPRQPTETEIRQQLDRIFASAEFHSPQRGRAFLLFIVDETLAGRSEFLKAFTIANVVFGRNVSFDAQNDPVVRIEAGRMRRALERYYLVVGRMDRVVITIPKGGYVPSFNYAESVKVRSADPAFDPVPASERGTMAHRWPLAQLIGRSRPLWVGCGLLACAAPFALAVFFHIPLTSSFIPLPGASPPTAIANATEPTILVEQFQPLSKWIARGRRPSFWVMNATYELSTPPLKPITQSYSRLRPASLIRSTNAPSSTSRSPRFALSTTDRTKRSYFKQWLQIPFSSKEIWGSDVSITQRTQIW